MTNEKSLIDRLEDIDPYDDPALASVVMDDAKQEITQLRGNLSLAEEGLANYALQVERLRASLTSIKSMAAGARQTMIASDILQAARNALAGTGHEPLSVGSPVTFTPRYASTLLRDGWIIDRLPPEPTYVIRHPEGTAIAVSAGEIQAAEKSNPAQCGCNTEDPYVCSKAKPHEHEPCYCQCHKL